LTRSSLVSVSLSLSKIPNILSKTLSDEDPSIATEVRTLANGPTVILDALRLLWDFEDRGCVVRRDDGDLLVGPARRCNDPRHHPELAYERSATSRKMAVAITTTTANRSHVDGLNGFVSMRTSIVVRHRNVDGVHRTALEVSAVRLPVLAKGGYRESGASLS
jgi:hypothetical protein